MAIYTAYPELVCTACGASFRPPAGTTQKIYSAVVEEESAHCARVCELTAQQQKVLASMRAGLAAVTTTNDMDTVDVYANRLSLARLEAAINKEKLDLLASMRHRPPGAR